MEHIHTLSTIHNVVLTIKTTENVETIYSNSKVSTCNFKDGEEIQNN